MIKAFYVVSNKLTKRRANKLTNHLYNLGSTNRMRSITCIFMGSKYISAVIRHSILLRNFTLVFITALLGFNLSRSKPVHIFAIHLFLCT